MRLPWPDGRCIFCGEAATESHDHVIPQSIGGRLELPFECQTCGNDKLGSRVEGQIRQSVQIALAAVSLEHEIPELASRILERSTYIADAGDHRVPFTRTRDGFRLREGDAGDAGTILRPASSHRMVRSHLEQLGRDADEIKTVLDALAAHPKDEPFVVSDELTVVNRAVTHDRLRYGVDGPLLNDLTMPLIAYRFLAVIAQGATFAAQLDGVRAWLLGDAEQPDTIRVDEGFVGDGAAAVHGIGISHDEDDGHVVIRVALFGSIAADVHFLNVELPVDGAYELDLRTGDSISTLAPREGEGVPPARRTAGLDRNGDGIGCE